VGYGISPGGWSGENSLGPPNSRPGLPWENFPGTGRSPRCNPSTSSPPRPRRTPWKRYVRRLTGRRPGVKRGAGACVRASGARQRHSMRGSKRCGRCAALVTKILKRGGGGASVWPCVRLLAGGDLEVGHGVQAARAICRHSGPDALISLACGTLARRLGRLVIRFRHIGRMHAWPHGRDA
jgi:hypothetical protein